MQVSLHQRTDVALNHRIAAAWASFSSHRKELTNKRYPLKCRLRLFDATVTATVLYSCESWTLKLDQQRRLRKVQRCMLRMIIGSKRHTKPPSQSSSSDSEIGIADVDDPDPVMEPWPEYLKRTARLTEEKLQDVGLNEWADQWRRRQWKYAGKLCSQQEHTWAFKLLKCEPFIHSAKHGSRAQSRPKKRWREDIDSFLQSLNSEYTMEKLAKNKKEWHRLESEFLAWCRISLR